MQFVQVPVVKQIPNSSNSHRGLTWVKIFDHWINKNCTRHAIRLGELTFINVLLSFIAAALLIFSTPTFKHKEGKHYYFNLGKFYVWLNKGHIWSPNDRSNSQVSRAASCGAKINPDLIMNSILILHIVMWGGTPGIYSRICVDSFRKNLHYEIKIVNNVNVIDVIFMTAALCREILGIHWLLSLLISPACRQMKLKSEKTTNKSWKFKPSQ